jgi:hypothetical protein
MNSPVRFILGIIADQFCDRRLAGQRAIHVVVPQRPIRHHGELRLGRGLHERKTAAGRAVEVRGNASITHDARQQKVCS